jgi:hypothetical protein
MSKQQRSKTIEAVYKKITEISSMKDLSAAEFAEIYGEFGKCHDLMAYVNAHFCMVCGERGCLRDCCRNLSSQHS